MNEKSQGFTFVEIIVSIVLLVVLALGGAAVMFQTGGSIQRQQNKREALVAANAVMEYFWNQAYDAEDPAVIDIVAREGTTISRSKEVNGKTMTAQVSFSNKALDADGNEYIEITVEIDHLGIEDDVIITTRRYAFGLSRAAL